MKKMPKQLFIKIHDPGTRDEYLVAYPKLEDHTEIGRERTKIGVYKLDKIIEVKEEISVLCEVGE